MNTVFRKTGLRQAGAAALVLALSLPAGGAWAQAATDRAAHHPQATAPKGAAPSAAMPGNPSAMPGQPGGGMPAGMGNAMMGGGAGPAEGGTPPMMQMMQMMQMMGGMMERGAAMPAAGMMRFDHIAGRIAFLKAELGITPAQEQPWTAFADALKDTAAKIEPMRTRMRGAIATGPFPERLRQQTSLLEARVAALRALAGPADALYHALTPAQRNQADALMTGPRGMM